MRIICCVPSLTELLCDLGLESLIVGITKFCIHPDSNFRNTERIGGTKSLNIKKIKNLAPDIVIANKEENVREQIAQIELFTEVVLSNIKNIDDNIELISTLSSRIPQIINNDLWLDRFEAFKNLKFPYRNQSVLYVIWNDPIMAAGGDTFISSMLEKIGLENVIKNRERYPEISSNSIDQLNPDYIFLSSEPFPFKEKHVELFQSLNRMSKVYLVDGEAFSWYGTRVLKKVPYLKKLLLNLK